MLRGIDISYWDRDINLERVIELNDLDFVIMKATESVNDVDSWCDSFYQIAKRKNVKRGVYHLLTSAARGRTQADYFLDHIGGYVHDAMLILDIEGTSSYYTRDVPTAVEFCERIISETGVKPVVYMNMATLDAEDWTPVVELGCDLWIANYWFGDMSVDWDDMDPDSHMASPDEFPYAALWQFTETGHVLGYGGNLDLDFAFMTLDAWDLYADPKGGAHENEGGKDEPETVPDATDTGAALVGKTLTVRIESVG